MAAASWRLLLRQWPQWCIVAMQVAEFACEALYHMLALLPKASTMV